MDAATTMPLREQVWKRLASDMRPGKLEEICRTVPFAQLPGAFDDFIASRIRGRVVIDLNE